MFYFTIGWIIKQHVQKIKKFLNSLNITGIFISSGLIWLVLSYWLMKWNVWPVRFVTTTVGMIFFYSLSLQLVNMKCYLLLEFSRYSLPLYLMNGYLLVVSRTFFVNNCGITSPILIVALNMLVTLFISWIGIKYIIDKTKIRVLFGLK